MCMRRHEQVVGPIPSHSTGIVSHLRLPGPELSGGGSMSRQYWPLTQGSASQVGKMPSSGSAPASVASIEITSRKATTSATSLLASVTLRSSVASFPPLATSPPQATAAMARTRAVARTTAGHEDIVLISLQKATTFHDAAAPRRRRPTAAPRGRGGSSRASRGARPRAPPREQGARREGAARPSPKRAPSWRAALSSWARVALRA